MTKEMKYYLENREVKEYMTKYYSLEYDGMKAKYVCMNGGIEIKSLC